MGACATKPKVTESDAAPAPVPKEEPLTVTNDGETTKEVNKVEAKEREVLIEDDDQEKKVLDVTAHEDDNKQSLAGLLKEQVEEPKDDKPVVSAPVEAVKEEEKSEVTTGESSTNVADAIVTSEPAPVVTITEKAAEVVAPVVVEKVVEEPKPTPVAAPVVVEKVEEEPKPAPIVAPVAEKLVEEPKPAPVVAPAIIEKEIASSVENPTAVVDVRQEKPVVVVEDLPVLPSSEKVTEEVPKEK